MAKSSDHDDALLAEVIKHPGFTVLRDRVERRRELGSLRLADKIIASNKPIEQREIDEERGFWRGVDWFIRETKRGASAFDKGVEQE